MIIESLSSTSGVFYRSARFPRSSYAWNSTLPFTLPRPCPTSSSTPSDYLFGPQTLPTTPSRPLAPHSGLGALPAAAAPRLGLRTGRHHWLQLGELAESAAVLRGQQLTAPRPWHGLRQTLRVPVASSRRARERGNRERALPVLVLAGQICRRKGFRKLREPCLARFWQQDSGSAPLRWLADATESLSLVKLMALSHHLVMLVPSGATTPPHMLFLKPFLHAFKATPFSSSSCTNISRTFGFCGGFVIPLGGALRYSLIAAIGPTCKRVNGSVGH